MNKIRGKPWADVWHELPFSAKENIIRQLALFCSETFQKQLTGIGSLFTASSQESSDVEAHDDHNKNLVFKVSRMVSTSFINRGPCPNVYRGPFASSREWLSSRLDHAEIDCQQRLGRLNERPDSPGDEECKEQYKPRSDNDEDDDDDDDDKEGEDSEDDDDEEDEEEEEEDEDEDPEDLENALIIIAKLRAQLNNFFPSPPGAEPEASIVFHDDLNQHNVLVDEDGALSAVVNWECISTFPLSIACQYPSILQGKPLDVEPIKSQYQAQAGGEVPELYWEHLENYELTKLRAVFLEEMHRLQPRWVEVFQLSEPQRDFVLAVEGADDPFMIRRILGWLGDAESGANNVPGLEERIDNGML